MTTLYDVAQREQIERIQNEAFRMADRIRRYQQIHELARKFRDERDALKIQLNALKDLSYYETITMESGDVPDR